LKGIYKQYMENPTFHIGEIITKELKEQGRTKTWLAEQVHCDSSNFNRMLQKPYIDMNMLRRISIAMGTNFGDEFKKKIDVDIESKKNEK